MKFFCTIRGKVSFRCDCCNEKVKRLVLFIEGTENDCKNDYEADGLFVCAKCLKAGLSLLEDKEKKL